MSYRTPNLASFQIGIYHSSLKNARRIVRKLVCNINYRPSSKLAHAVPLLTYTLKVIGLNPGRDTEYPKLIVFLPAPPDEFWEWCLGIGHDSFLPSLLIERGNLPISFDAT